MFPCKLDGSFHTVSATAAPTQNFLKLSTKLEAYEKYLKQNSLQECYCFCAHSVMPGREYKQYKINNGRNALNNLSFSKILHPNWESPFENPSSEDDPLRRIFL